MPTVNIHEAKTHLSRLLGRAANGEPFIIAKAGKPLVEGGSICDIVKTVVNHKVTSGSGIERLVGLGIGRRSEAWSGDTRVDGTVDRHFAAIEHR
jgi:hypothetical protein